MAKNFFYIEPSEINRLEEQIKKELYIPKLDSIAIGVKNNVTDITKNYKGVSEFSIGDTGAVVIDKSKYKTLEANVLPVNDKVDVFKSNIEGYNNDVFVFVNISDDLKKWVEQKYNGKDKSLILANKKALRIRNKNAGGYPPLGSPYRNFFVRGLNAFLDRRNEFDLT